MNPDLFGILCYLTGTIWVICFMGMVTEGLFMPDKTKIETFMYLLFYIGSIVLGAVCFSQFSHHLFHYFKTWTSTS